MNNSKVPINMNALRAGCSMCSAMGSYVENIERDYEGELIVTDFKENTYTDYLRTFLDSSWIQRQSFCMSGQFEVELRETLAPFTGLCFTLNPDDIFDSRT